MKEIPDPPALVELEIRCSWMGCERTAPGGLQHMPAEWKYLILATGTGCRTGEEFASKMYGVLCREHSQDVRHLLRV